MKDDLDAVLEALEHGRGAGDVDGDEAIGINDRASDHARRLAHEVGDALLDLKDDSEPGWLKRTDSGRLNVRRLADPFADADQLFDRYEPGQMDASELELVLLLDVSSSMHKSTFSLGEATWAIRQAVDDIDGKATVLTFETRHWVLAHPGQRPDDRMFVPHSMGGTNPLTALREAFRILADSRARNRLMVVLTDGDWSWPEKNEALIAAMREDGVTTVLGFLSAPGYLQRLNPHGCEVAETINRPEGLAQLFRKVAAAKIAAWK